MTALEPRHRDSHAPNYPERERQAIDLLAEDHPEWAWRLLAEGMRQRYRAYAEAVEAHRLRQITALESDLDIPPHRASVWDRLKEGK